MSSEEKKPIAIIGAGGHAKVLLDALLLCEKTVVALVEKYPSNISSLWGVPVIEEEAFFSRYKPEEIFLVNGIGSVKSLELRQNIYDKFKERGFEFTSVVHPSTVISPRCELAEDVQIMAGAVVQAGCQIGNNTIINTRATIDHDCKIGRHVHVAPGVIISGNVKIGEKTHIGVGAVVIQGTHVGKRVLIAAGAVVLRNIEDRMIYKSILSICEEGKNGN